MKILLINPPIREWSKPNCFPLGLGSVAAVLQRANHEVTVFDINGHRHPRVEVEKIIKESSPDVIGIGGIVTVYKYVKWLVEVIRKFHPSIKIIIGGSLGSSIPEIMLTKNKVDIICIGEGEITAAEVVGALEKNSELSAIKGIWFKQNDGSIRKNELRPPISNLDDLSFAAWNLFPIAVYLKNPIGAINTEKWADGSPQTVTPLSMNLYASRGCPYQCIYCYHDFMGQGYRQRSPENVIREIEVLHKKFGVEYFHFIDDEFMMKEAFTFKFCELINGLRKKINKNITWGCAGRVNLVNEKVIKAMANNGCIQICYGIESGSQKILDLINKKVTTDQAKSAIRLTQKHLGFADCTFMIGYPGENNETIQETITFCRELKLAPEAIFFLTPYPGTEIYKMALKQGKIQDEENYLLSLGEQGENLSVNFTDFSDERLIEIRHEMVNKLRAWNKVIHK